jgi:hypothetical protein
MTAQKRALARRKADKSAATGEGSALVSSSGATGNSETPVTV